MASVMCPVERMFDGIDLSLPEWEILERLWSSAGYGPSLVMRDWVISESLQGMPLFGLRRDKVSGRRFTDVDRLNLLGLTLINPRDPRCWITEGVSDYLTCKLLHPRDNVLGSTILGGSVDAQRVVASLFDDVVVCADRDASGMRGAMRWVSTLRGLGKKVEIYTPAVGKDVTDEFMLNLRFADGGALKY